MIKSILYTIVLFLTICFVITMGIRYYTLPCDQMKIDLLLQWGQAPIRCVK